MACLEFENKILEYAQLPRDVRMRVDGHLSDCAACRAFAKQMEQLDAKLINAIQAPALRPDFRVRVHQQILASPVMTVAEIAERKRQLQAEYEAGLAEITLFSRPSRSLMKALQYTTLLGSSAWLAWLFIPQLMDLAVQTSPVELNQGSSMTLVASVIFAAVGVATAFPRQLQRMMRLH